MAMSMLACLLARHENLMFMPTTESCSWYFSSKLSMTHEFASSSKERTAPCILTSWYSAMSGVGWSRTGISFGFTFSVDGARHHGRWVVLHLPAKHSTAHRVTALDFVLRCLAWDPHKESANNKVHAPPSWSCQMTAARKCFAAGPLKDLLIIDLTMTSFQW